METTFFTELEVTLSNQYDVSVKIGTLAGGAAVMLHPKALDICQC